MAYHQQFTCSAPNCKAVRGETNHWLLIVTDHRHFATFSWDEMKAREPNTEHVCGRACAQVLFEKFLERSSSLPEKEHGV